MNNTPEFTTMIYEIDILDGVMVLFDEDGSSFESATLTTYGNAIQTIRRWVKRYPLNVGNAYRMIYDHFLSAAAHA
jgi:hypothetical protein